MAWLAYLPVYYRGPVKGLPPPRDPQWWPEHLRLRVRLLLGP